MHALNIFLPILFSIQEVAGFPAPIPIQHPYYQATDAIVEQPWGQRTASRIAGFEKQWHDREDRKSSFPYPDMAAETELDKKLKGYEERHQMRVPCEETRMNEGKAEDDVEDENEQVPLIEKRQKITRLPLSYNNPNECRNGAVPGSIHGNFKFPETTGFFDFAEKAIGTKYNPEQLTEARDHLVRGISTVSERERERKEAENALPPQVSYDEEFVQFSGLEVEEVTPTTQDVFREEAYKMGMPEIDAIRPSKGIQKRQGPLTKTTATTATTTTNDTAPSMEVNSTTIGDIFSVIVIEDIRRYFVFLQATNTDTVGMRAEGVEDIDVNFNLVNSGIPSGNNITALDDVIADSAGEERASRMITHGTEQHLLADNSIQRELNTIAKQLALQDALLGKRDVSNLPPPTSPSPPVPEEVQPMEEYPVRTAVDAREEIDLAFKELPWCGVSDQQVIAFLDSLLKGLPDDD
jgi:hypothetical protein